MRQIIEDLPQTRASKYQPMVRELPEIVAAELGHVSEDEEESESLDEN